MHAGIDRLEAGEATPGRARLYRTLGWIMVLAGRNEEAIPRLQRAIDEARASSDERTLRWALMDMAISVDTAEGAEAAVEMMQESHRLSRAAGDRSLVQRALSNLAWTHLERGDPLESIAAMLREGLRQARREYEGGSEPTMALNLAMVEAHMGRLDDALVHIEEAISAATAVAKPTGTILSDRSILHRLRGELAEAERTEAELESMAFEPDPQLAYTHLRREAYAAWARDPATALRDLRAHLEEVDLWWDVWGNLLYLLARMAIRLGDADLVQWPSKSTVGDAPPARRRCWPRIGRRTDSFADDAGVAIEEAAATLERHGYIWRALEAWTDAALLAARAGRASVARERALAITRRYGMHPPLGPLPETRWLGPRPG